MAFFCGDVIDVLIHEQHPITLSGIHQIGVLKPQSVTQAFFRQCSTVLPFVLMQTLAWPCRCPIKTQIFLTSSLSSAHELWLFNTLKWVQGKARGYLSHNCIFQLAVGMPKLRFLERSRLKWMASYILKLTFCCVSNPHYSAYALQVCLVPGQWCNKEAWQPMEINWHAVWCWRASYPGYDHVRRHWPKKPVAESKLAKSGAWQSCYAVFLHLPKSRALQNISIGTKMEKSRNMRQIFFFASHVSVTFGDDLRDFRRAIFWWSSIHQVSGRWRLFMGRGKHIGSMRSDKKHCSGTAFFTMFHGSDRLVQ